MEITLRKTRKQQLTSMWILQAASQGNCTLRQITWFSCKFSQNQGLFCWNFVTSGKQTGKCLKIENVLSTKVQWLFPFSLEIFLIRK